MSKSTFTYLFMILKSIIKYASHLDQFKMMSSNVAKWCHIATTVVLYTSQQSVKIYTFTSKFLILGTAELHWNCSSIPKDGSDIHRFPTWHMVKIHFLLENLWISEQSLGIYFPIRHHCKIQSEFSDLLEKSRGACSSSTKYERLSADKQHVLC